MFLSNFFIQKSSFITNGQKAYFLLNILHLFKSIRNNLFKNDFSTNGSLLSWSDKVWLWNLGKNKYTRAIYKLPKKHIESDSFDKMKCKFALDVFSKEQSYYFTASLTGCIQATMVQHTATFFEISHNLLNNLNKKGARDPILMRVYFNEADNL